MPSPILPLSLLSSPQPRFLAPFLPATHLSSHASDLSLYWSRTVLQTRITVQITQVSNKSSNHFSQLGTQLATHHFDPGPTHSQAYKERQSSSIPSCPPDPQPPPGWTCHYRTHTWHVEAPVCLLLLSCCCKSAAYLAFSLLGCSNFIFLVRRREGSKRCLTAQLLLLGHQKQSQQKQESKRI